MGEYDDMFLDQKQFTPRGVVALKIENERLRAERTYYRDMWLAQRVENENYRKQLGLVSVSDEAERALAHGKGE